MLPVQKQNYDTNKIKLELITSEVYKHKRHSESRAFHSAVEHEVTNLIWFKTPSLSANCLSSSRYFNIFF